LYTNEQTVALRTQVAFIIALRLNAGGYILYYHCRSLFA